MSQRQWKRMEVIERLEKGALTVEEAGKVLGLSGRQVQRVRKAVRRLGRQDVVHGNAGRKSPRKTRDALARKVVRLMKTRYAGFNDQHFTEKLAENEGVALGCSTVRRILREAGIGAARKRRPPKHRRRRDRKPQAGLMMQWDGSRHDWLEGRGPWLCLMAAIDDATGDVLPGAHFVAQECTAGYLRVLRAVVEEKGVPGSAYGDQHSSLKRNDDNWTLEEELRGEQDPTQVSRALKALDIERIDALSPQAKGRVERLWGTFQDRLVSELRLAGARTLAQANKVLERHVPRHNRKFAVPAQDTSPAWGRLRPGTDLDRVCSFYYACVVSNDNTVRLGGDVLIDIPPGPGNRGYAKAVVEVRQLLDGSWRVYRANEVIATKAANGHGELRAKKTRKRSASSRAFRRGVTQVSASLP